MAENPTEADHKPSGQPEDQLAAACRRRRLVEGVEHHLERIRRHHQLQVVQQLQVQMPVPYHQPEDRRHRQQRRKQRKQEVVAQLRRAREQVVVVEGVEGALRHRPRRHPLEVPKIVQRRMVHMVPDALTQWVRRPHRMVLRILRHALHSLFRHRNLSLAPTRTKS